ncbi:MAG: hypothetical protein ACYDIC_08005 [Desulfobaccales bacterium]
MEKKGWLAVLTFILTITLAAAFPLNTQAQMKGGKGGGGGGGARMGAGSPGTRMGSGSMTTNRMGSGTMPSGQITPGGNGPGKQG